MTAAPTTREPAPAEAAPAEGAAPDAHAVLSTRLAAAAAVLGERAQALDAARVAVFGAGETLLTGALRVRTQRPATPADIAAVGPYLLFAANPAEVRDVGDVFQVLRPAGQDAGAAAMEPVAAPDGLLDDPAFLHDFRELYRYYRQTRVLRLRTREGLLQAVFRTGAEPGDVRVLSWRTAQDGRCGYEGAGRESPPDPVGAPALNWMPLGRAHQVPGRRPHLAVTAADGGVLTVDTTGGRLRVRTGDTVHEEPVDDALQSLADADAGYATVGPLVLLRVRPYREDADRYFTVNTRTARIERTDVPARSYLPLPEGQGVVFPGGVALAAGGTRTFDLGPQAAPGQLEFERLVRAPGGADVLYVFHAADDGRRLLLPYRLVRQEAAAPLHVQGCALYEDGTLLTLRPADGGEPGRVHTVQRWRTPFAADTWAPPAGDGPLQRIGNPDLVRAVSDTLALARAAHGPAPAPARYAARYEALAAAADRVLDRHPWLAAPAPGGDPAAAGLAAPVGEIRDTARRALAEHARVRDLTAQAARAAAQAEARIAALRRLIRGESAATAAEWVRRLTELADAQAGLAALRDMRYADRARLDAADADLARESAHAAARAAECFADPHAFDAPRARVAELDAAAPEIGAAAEAAPLAAALDEQAAALTTVTATATGLDGGDATVRTRVLESAAAVLGEVNRARARLEARRTELAAAESAVEFAAEGALLAQETAAALAAAGTPEACDDRLGSLLARVEHLAARFADVPERAAALDARRAAIEQALTARRQQLADERAARVRGLTASARRARAAVRRRAAGLASAQEVHACFAADPMAREHRRIAARLRDLGEPGLAAELDAALAAARQDTARALRDRLDLYEDGGATLRLGRHRFPVDPHPFSLALVPHGGGLAFTVPGTDYLRPVHDPALPARFLDRPLPSESPALYRAEYLAATLFDDADTPAAGPLPEPAAVVAAAVAARPDEGYERGVHDHDAALILDALRRLGAGAGLLRHPAGVRTAAQLFWAHGPDAAARTAWTTRARSLTRAASAFAPASAPAPDSASASQRPSPAAAVDALAAELGAAAVGFTAGLLADASAAAPDATTAALLGAYLVAELADERPGFAEAAGARALRGRFTAALGGPDGAAYKEFAADLESLEDDPAARRELALAWLGAFAAAEGDGGGQDGGGHLLEAAVGLAVGARLPRYPVDAPTAVRVTGLLGTHPRIGADRGLDVRVDELPARVRRFRAEEAPAYRAYRRRRGELLAAEGRRLALDDHRPHPLPGFVRNRLLDEVYLPLVGDSLAKQFGPEGGLLMLMSPPGYGKTSLVEYVAARLGLALVRVSGPALGAATTSLDPAAAPDAGARRELEKIDLALRLGANTLLYVDDIQHTSPELLQKFIPLCDAQRRIEGPEGPYDLRGKRFAVCMAGNPYTESGALFRVPDMLADRADVWSLAEVLGGREDLFALSYLENALTANPVLAPLAGRDRADLELLLRLAQSDPAARAQDLAHPYAEDELGEILAVLRHLLRARTTLLAVNAAYTASAAQSHAARTEPPFLLQGSYRAMTKIAGRVLAAMDDAELDAVVSDHYRAEAQTLAGGAEAALLKLAELRGALTSAEAARWSDLKARYAR
ncbi:DNA repair ATPase [Streptomyces sp. V4-01]|uniref:DNA repair ATPase n=1 Tax=Actinacidiphila polyblastidii TaxID=3110430 RepID=A0ABU7PHC6_9ACTN|nr:DNA repair ATPase [Streptomyces sp. V4-01]